MNESGKPEETLKPGKQVRELTLRASEAQDLADRLLAVRQETRQAVEGAFARVRSAAVREHLANVPIERLREATSGGLRLGAIGQRYSSVVELLDLRPAHLEQIPGVGPTTASQAIAAARHLAEIAGENIQIRLDPDRRSPASTELLRQLRRFDTAERELPALEPSASELRTQLARLSDEAALATRPVRMFFSGRSRRDSALEAARTLQRLLDAPRTESTLHLLSTTLDGCEPTTGDSELWRDFESRAGDYYAALGEAADFNLDVDAATGFLPAEIASAVARQQLDQSLLDVVLRGYQAFGAKFALVQKRTIIGDEMGLGKTITALAAICHLRALDEKHFLVICPTSVLVNWEHELARRTKQRSFRLHGSARSRTMKTWLERGGVALTTFDTLRALKIPDDLRLGMLVVDEAHYVKNPSALRTKAVLSRCRGTDRVMFLTGTPMENRVDEFRNLVHMLRPDVASRLHAAHGLAGADAFRRSVAPVYLRRNQTDVLSELPERLEMEDWVDLSPVDEGHYRDAVASGNFMAMRRAAYEAQEPSASAKLERLLEIVAESQAEGWKVVIFSFFRSVLSAVHAAVGDGVVGELTGSVPPGRRQAIVDEFSRLQGHGVLVSQIQAGGVGLNMQAASVVILTEPQWKPTVEEQAVARCHRMGQVRRVRVHRLLAEDSVDARMLELLSQKSRLFDEYARRSSITEASPEAVDISEAAAARLIVEQEQERLGLAPRWAEDEVRF